MTWNESDALCQEFESNRYAKTGKVARRCLQCGRDIQEHRSEVVPKDQVLKAIEADANVPSTILGEGSLYLGGFAAGMNRNFLTQKTDAVGLVVNAANLALDQQFHTCISNLINS